MKRILTALSLCLASPAVAHPHIFVDAGLEVVVDDQGRLTHVRVTWAYDALYSLLITEDMGLDSDGDAVLSKTEIATLTGFDMQWVDGFNGDLVASLNATPLHLGPPLAATADMREGRVITTHLRAVTGQPSILGKAVSFRPYDATFYTAYDVTLGVTVKGADCAVALTPPVFDETLSALREQLAGLGIDQDPQDVGLADAGAAFATDIGLTCVE